ncbi:MAG TPA: hypothetical protein VLH56_17300 [Dissulfurispiraceae bacterium]|nr:hypothetical protein [Dissulfurispiraceae bacterium]
MNDGIDLKKIANSGADERVIEVYRLLSQYMRQPERKAWLKMRQECSDAVYESAIWTDEEKAQMLKKDMIPLTINDLYKGVQGSAAVVTDQKPGVEFLPVGSGDLYVAELMKRAHDQVWAQNDGGTELFEFVKEAKISGLPCMDVKHDPAKGIYGKVVIGNFDPETLYYDMQKCRKADLSDVTVMKAHLVSRTYCKDTYEGITDEDLVFEGVKPPDTGLMTDTVTGKDNYTINTKDTPIGPDDYPEEKEDIWEIEAHILKRDKEIWLMVPDGTGGYSREVFKESQKAEAKEKAATMPNALLWSRVVEKRYLRIVVGKKLIKQRQDDKEVDEIPNAYGVDVDGDPVLPIIAMVHERTRKGKPVSPTIFAKEACRERNKRRAQAIYVVTKNIDAPIQMPEGAKWVKDPIHGDFIRVGKDAAFAPSRLAPGNTSAEALNLEAVAKADVDDMYDMHDVMKGKVPPGRPAMQTVLALIDMGGMMSKPFTRSLEAALVRLGKVTMYCILRNWPRSMWERLIEPDEMGTWEPDNAKPQQSPVEEMNAMGQQPDPDEEEAKKQEIQAKWAAALEILRPADMSKEPGLSLLDVDVRVTAGSTMPTNRLARQQMAIELVKGGIYDQEAALEYVDDPHKDQVVARMKAKEQKMMMMAASGAQAPKQ